MFTSPISLWCLVNYLRCDVCDILSLYTGVEIGDCRVWLHSVNLGYSELRVPQMSKSQLPQIATFYAQFLFLACYIPNAAKRSIWHQYMCILTTDWWPILHLWKFRMAISLQQVVRSTSCLVLGYGFRCWRIEWRYFWLDQIQDDWPRLGKFWMAISLQRVIRSTLCLVLG